MKAEYIEARILKDEMVVEDKDEETTFSDSFKKAASAMGAFFSAFFIPMQNAKTGLRELKPKYRTHPDLKVIESWLASRRLDPGELDVICWMATFVLLEWRHGPKRTAAEHRKLCNRISALCNDLIQSLNATQDLYMGGTTLGLFNATVGELLTHEELSESFGRLHYALTPVADALAISKLAKAIQKPFDLPMEELLARLAKAANDLAGRAQLHAQPKKRGASRGFFVRVISKLLKHRYGEQPIEVIAALTTIALGEATDRELVAKLLA